MLYDLAAINETVIQKNRSKVKWRLFYWQFLHLIFLTNSNTPFSLSSPTPRLPSLSNFFLYVWKRKRKKKKARKKKTIMHSNKSSSAHFFINCVNVFYYICSQLLLSIIIIITLLYILFNFEIFLKLLCDYISDKNDVMKI